MVNCLFEIENNWVCFLALNLSSLNVNMSLSIEIYLSATLPFYVFAALNLISFYIFSFLIRMLAFNTSLATRRAKGCNPLTNF